MVRAPPQAQSDAPREWHGVANDRSPRLRKTPRVSDGRNSRFGGRACFEGSSSPLTVGSLTLRGEAAWLCARLGKVHSTAAAPPPGHCGFAVPKGSIQRGGGFDRRGLPSSVTALQEERFRSKVRNGSGFVRLLADQASRCAAVEVAAPPCRPCAGLTPATFGEYRGLVGAGADSD